MPLKDQKINTLVQLENSLKDKSKKIRKENYTPLSINAGKLSIKSIPSKSIVIKSMIDTISEASDRGKFICEFTPVARYRNELFKYLKSHNYIIASNKSEIDWYIIWIGGDRWRKLYYPKSKSQDKLWWAKLAYKHIKSELGIESDYELNEIKFINPRSSISDSEIDISKKLIPFFDKMY